MTAATVVKDVRVAARNGKWRLPFSSSLLLFLCGQKRALASLQPFCMPRPTVGPQLNRNSLRARTAQLALHFTDLPSRTSSSMAYSKQAATYVARKVAVPHTLDHRIYIEKNGVPISPFHDVPLYANEQQTVLNMIVEIPRWTNAKLEASFPLL